MTPENLLSCYYCCTSFNKEDMAAFGLSLSDNDEKLFCPKCGIPAIIPYMAEDKLDKYHCKQFNHSVSLKRGFKSINDIIERHYCHCPQDPCCVNCDTDAKNKALDKWGFERYFRTVEKRLISFIRWLTDYNKYHHKD